MRWAKCLIDFRKLFCTYMSKQQKLLLLRTYQIKNFLEIHTDSTTRNVFPTSRGMNQNAYFFRTNFRCTITKYKQQRINYITFSATIRANYGRKILQNKIQNINSIFWRFCRFNLKLNQFIWTSLTIFVQVSSFSTSVPQRTDIQ